MNFKTWRVHETNMYMWNCVNNVDLKISDNISLKKQNKEYTTHQTTPNAP